MIPHADAWGGRGTIKKGPVWKRSFPLGDQPERRADAVADGRSERSIWPLMLAHTSENLALGMPAYPAWCTLRSEAGPAPSRGIGISGGWSS